MRKIKISILLVILSYYNMVYGQTPTEEFENFRRAAHTEYASFWVEFNKKYADFIRNAWKWYEEAPPMPLPDDKTPVPPRPYDGEEQVPIVINPIDVEPVEVEPQPKPLEPIREVPAPYDEYFEFGFYGVSGKVRLPQLAKSIIKDTSPESLADGWACLCNANMNNAIRGCLEARIRYNLCDWAYLMFLNQLAKNYCENDNGATLLTAFLYCQSGYQMRLAVDGAKLVMLYGSKHQIFEKGYFNIDGVCFYPLGEPANSISICGAAFEGETPMSLIIEKEQLLGVDMSAERTVTAERNKNMSITSYVPQRLIEFYNTYPKSALDGNPMTRWAMYTNTPLAQKTKDKLYPPLRKCISKDDKLLAAEMLLKWVQTGFVYEYDNCV